MSLTCFDHIDRLFGYRLPNGVVAPTDVSNELRLGASVASTGII